MATMRDIEIKRELRPCLIVSNSKSITEPIKALFHTWEHNSQIIPPSIMRGGHSGGVVSEVMGIVELESGEVIRVQPHKIQFVDNKVQEYCFESAGRSHEIGGAE